MGCLGNLLWFIFGGALSGLSWCLAGCLWCISIVGIPVGVQCFKLASLSFFPFGKEVQYGGGAGSLLLNILWLILSGLPLTVEHAALGVLLCVTIVGIPFGLQHFKLAKLALFYESRVRTAPINRGIRFCVSIIMHRKGRFRQTVLNSSCFGKPVRSIVAEAAAAFVPRSSTIMRVL